MKERSRFGLFALAISLMVVVLVRNCNAASISPSIDDNGLTNGTSAPLIEDEDYYSNEDDYDYKDEDKSPTSLNVTTSTSTTSTTTTTTTTKVLTTSSTASSFLETNHLSLEETDSSPQLQPCPLECHCDNGFVNCSNVHLSELPQDLPTNVVILDLSENTLGDFDLNDLTRFTELRELNLSHNIIGSITKLSSAAVKFPKLTTIDLADNSLEAPIDPDTFEGMTGLRKLTLDNNSISMPEHSLFNLPDLEELSMRHCNLDGLSAEIFSNLMGLKVLDMSGNPFKTEFDVNTFEPLVSIKKLRMGLTSEEQVLELCMLLTTIDVIDFPEFKISCFEYVNGYTFEKSMVSNTLAPEIEEPLPIPVDDPAHIDDRKTDDEPKDKEPEQDDKISDPHNEDPLLRALPSTIPDTTPLPSTDDSNLEKQTSGIDQQLMDHLLLVIIGVAFIGLVIGIICRKDYCGVKTKCCRTRRPSQTDQVTPAPEEVPLNKITTLPTNGANGNGTATTALNGNATDTSQ